MNSNNILTKEQKIERYKLSMGIADLLKETTPHVRYQIHIIVKALGIRQVLDIAKKAVNISKTGGMMTLDQSRKKTLGGIFFHLAYTTGKPLNDKLTIKRNRFILKTSLNPEDSTPKEAPSTQNTT